MRGMPQKIQTPQDLRNLFGLWQDAGWQARHGAIDTEAFLEKIGSMCRQQFARVPILGADGNTVVTRFFNEAKGGSETDGGLKVTEVEHFTPPEDLLGDDGEEGAGPTCTRITLSGKLPKDGKLLSIKNSCNCLARGGFDIAEVARIRAALQDSMPKSEVM